MAWTPDRGDVVWILLTPRPRYPLRMGHPAIDIDSMPPEERLQLIGALWDSLRRIRDAIPVPQSHRDELDARLKALARGESEVLEWDEACRQMHRAGCRLSD